ncbi:MAG: aspartate aminotransferase family protein [Deltaproteobacteria bacterium]|nr:MAG: aspartate aminotransferase family protein [Deltaproteobacteria bacterium]
MTWEALSEETIRQRVFAALTENLSYGEDAVLGLPGSFLDRRVFPPLPELAGFPLLSTVRANPNHIGCHTLGDSEPAFAGTQAIEREVITLCAESLLGAEPGTIDGYVASGGTESNLQALWTLRNALRESHGFGPGEVGLLASEDTHYSVHKAANLMDMPLFSVAVDPNTRRMRAPSVRDAIAQARGRVKAVVAVLNMGTTMFGSIDHADDLLVPLAEAGMPHRTHVDAAFGGFVYPLVAEHPELDLRDPRIDTLTLDAHKMLQAPYGTGIHLARKGLIHHVLTASAAYVPGLDCTLSGSRSGANAVAVWMILRSYGFAGGRAFCRELVARARRLCDALERANVRHYRHPDMNVVTMRAGDLPEGLAERHMLVPDKHDGPAEWLKIVVMDHVTDGKIDAFLADLRASQAA